MTRLPAILIALLATAGAASAGTVEVHLLAPAQYADAGTSSWDEQANVQALSRHLQAMGPKLPGGQTLKVELLDLDMAGAVSPIRQVRVVRGKADFPRMKLRYTLESPGQAARSGEDTLSDLDYTRGLTSSRGSEPLYFEKRMLDDWFQKRFASN